MQLVVWIVPRPRTLAGLHAGRLRASRSRTLLPLVACALHLAGCGGSDQPYRKPTVPVTGQVLVDGQPPSSPIKVMCHDEKGMDQEHPSVSWCMTGDDGKFALSTYEAGDGVPPGSYVLTFEWGQLNMFSMQYGGPDKLKGRYSDPKQSQVRVTAGEEPVDLGRIELTTK
jgi:hypothetical protein